CERRCDQSVRRRPVSILGPGRGRGAARVIEVDQRLGAVAIGVVCILEPSGRSARRHKPVHAVVFVCMLRISRLDEGYTIGWVVSVAPPIQLLERSAAKSSFYINARTQLQP